MWLLGVLIYVLMMAIYVGLIAPSLRANASQ